MGRETDNMIRRLEILALAGTVTLGVAACGEGATAVAPETALLSVSPTGGAMAVDPAEPIEVTFDHAMHDHAADYAAVHEGDVTGPEVAGSWTLEQGGTVMRFAPETPLMEGTAYTIHLGGGMTDADGHVVDLETHGMSMGGEWVEGSMMGGGMMGGQDSHMGEGWQHPSNGSYGMIFTFTTAA